MKNFPVNDFSVSTVCWAHRFNDIRIMTPRTPVNAKHNASNTNNWVGDHFVIDEKIGEGLPYHHQFHITLLLQDHLAAFTEYTCAPIKNGDLLLSNQFRYYWAMNILQMNYIFYAIWGLLSHFS